MFLLGKTALTMTSCPRLVSSPALSIVHGSVNSEPQRKLVDCPQPEHMLELEAPHYPL